MSSASSSADREISAVREFDAPRELVFKLWTDPAHLTKWWGPFGFTTTTTSAEFRTGGQWKFIMHGPDGRDYLNRIEYVEFVAPERLVYKHAGEGADDDVRFHVTVSFEAISEKRTRLNMRMVFESKEARDTVIRERGAVEGLNGTMTRLGEHLAEETIEPLVITRIFKAPADVVFRCWTEVEHYKKWFGPVGMPITHCTIDLRPGGVCHYGLKQGDSATMWGKWVYREIDRPKRLSFVSSFSDELVGITKAPFPGLDWPLETLTTIDFVESNGQTTLTMRGVPVRATEAERKVFRDHFASMNQGWGGTFGQLDEYLAQLA